MSFSLNVEASVRILRRSGRNETMLRVTLRADEHRAALTPFWLQIILLQSERVSVAHVSLCWDGPRVTGSAARVRFKAQAGTLSPLSGDDNDMKLKLQASAAEAFRDLIMVDSIPN